MNSQHTPAQQPHFSPLDNTELDAVCGGVLGDLPVVNPLTPIPPVLKGDDAIWHIWSLPPKA
jgi:hypothetical protein